MDFVCFGVPPEDPDFRQGYWLQAYLMTMSVHRADPSSRVVFLTGPDVEVSKKIPFDAVERFAGDAAELMIWRTRAWIHHLQANPAARTVFLDPDILVQRAPEGAFAGDFDIGLTWNRPQGDIEHKINSGVVFCPPGGRATAFLDRILDGMAGMTRERRRWLGEQEAIARLLPPGTFDGVPPPQATVDGIRVRLLPCAEWNYFPTIGAFYGGPEPSPDSFRASPYAAPLVHFKGYRKNHMLMYAQSVLGIELPES